MGGINWNFERLSAHVKKAGVLIIELLKSMAALIATILLIFCELIVTLVEAIGLAVKKLVSIILKTKMYRKKVEEA